MPTDAELLHRYVTARDEQAFAELVGRHLGLVYASALRRVGGRAHLAEDIAQQVFCDLARKAPRLVGHPTLTGWLYRCTRYAATDGLRAEWRRQKLTETLITMPELSSDHAAVDWERIRPVLDAALDELRERDRAVLLLRAFHGLSFADVGARLALNENAARMRFERALDKLRLQLGRRGVTSTAAALGLILGQQALSAAPAGLAAVVSAAALSAAPAGAVAAVATFFLMSKIIAPMVTAAVAAGLTALCWQGFAPTVSAEEVAALRREHVRLQAVAATDAGSSDVAAVAAEFAVQALAVVRAMDRRQTTRAERSAAPENFRGGAVTGTARTEAGGHRNRGQATPHAAFMSFAWAGDAAEVAEIAKLLWFEEADRARALAVHASMPAALRERYRTPEELYAFFFAADALIAPPPGADLLERFESVELRPGRVALQRPGSRQNFHQYQLVGDGWKWVVPSVAVENAPAILNNEVLGRLGGE